MRPQRPMIRRASGPPGAAGCGLVLFCLGVFLLSPIGLLLIKGVAWVLVGLGVLLAGLAIWSWFRQR